jgi:LPXTG-site transpeptidase (sortase) family protein
MHENLESEMLKYRWIIVLAALALAACGGSAQSAQQAAAPTAAPAATSAPAPTAAATSAPTAEPTAEPTAAPTAEPTAEPTSAATATPEFRAEPTATAEPAGNAQAAPEPAKAPAGGPTRLVIEDIGLDYQPVSVGLDKHRVPIVPDHDVGWYNLSAGPGQGENIVLWGHVLRFRNAPKIPAPFAHVKDLKPGASVVLYDSDGNKHAYKITKQVWVTPDQVEYILPQGKEQVTMVSCIGEKVIQDGEVVDESHRLITIAEPA